MVVLRTILASTAAIAAAFMSCRPLQAADSTPSDSSSVATPPLREAPAFMNPAEFGIGRRIPDLTFQPLGAPSFPLRTSKTPVATVILFTSTSCPITRRYTPTIAALEKQFAPLGVRFICVNPIPSDSDSEIETTRRAHDLSAPYCRDSNGAIASALHAKTTAEAFLVDSAQTLVYRGAIDDQYGLGYSLNAPRYRYLQDALQALLDSKPITIAATTAPGCAIDPSVAPIPRSSPVTYHNQIARILQRHCTECHHPGGSAPFPLTSIQDVVSHAGMIRKVIEQGLMPPWFAAPSPSPQNQTIHWANDRSLTKLDRQTLLDWLKGDRPEGDPSEAPLPQNFPKDWAIGTPDAIFQIPTPIRVKASGKMPYQDVIVPTSLTEDRWVQALEVRPTAREVVHHVLVFVRSPEKGGTGDTNSPARRRRLGGGEGGNFFAVYVPGNNVLQYSQGFAKFLPAGSSLHFQIHYTPSGTETSDQTRLGMLFSKQPPQHEVRVAAVAPIVLRIPPQTSHHEVPAFLPVPFHARLLSFMPHMHLRGKAYRFELEDPQGKRTRLLDVPRYDFNWQVQYRLADPIDAPAGSRLHGTAWFDNSPANPANPDPDREVRFGVQTDDEMALGYVEYYLPGVPPGVESPVAIRGRRRDGSGLFDSLDRNRDGVITPDEAPSPEVFRIADTDGDGKVTREELQTLSRRRGR